jgi:hypothetical protein
MVMTIPRIFKPFAAFWFWLSETLGNIASKIVLSLLFFGLVLPMGLFRRILQKDSLQLGCWRNGDQSVFRPRNQKFSAKDLENPY